MVIHLVVHSKYRTGKFDERKIPPRQRGHLPGGVGLIHPIDAVAPTEDVDIPLTALRPWSAPDESHLEKTKEKRRRCRFENPGRSTSI